MKHNEIKKYILLLMLVLVLIFVLAACGNSNNVTETSSAADETEAVTETLQTAETDANGGNILIAYFSYTGNTEEAAQMIAEYTGGL